MENIITLDNTFSKVKSIEDIKKPNIRLFFELGYKIDIRKGVDSDNWIRTGRFKEIIDVESYVLHDSRLGDNGYIEHHNFHIKYDKD